MDNKPLTTTDVPAQFLHSTFLLGHIPWRALASDPRVSYGLYIPPSHFDPNPAAAKKLPLLVYIHGTRRNTSAIHDKHDLVAFADQTPCAVLAPLFPAGLDHPNDIDSYKLLRSNTLRSDLALLSILDEIAVRWPSIAAQKVFLMGFSGGGQFAQRFLYLYPERVEAVSIGAPGRVTGLDGTRCWPGGVKDVRTVFGRAVNKEVIRQVRIQLVVGRDDNVLHGGEDFWKWLKGMKTRSKRTDEEGESKEEVGELAQMRQGRLDTIRSLQSMWKQDGIESQLDIVEGMTHDEKPARRAVLGFLRSSMNA